MLTSSQDYNNQLSKKYVQERPQNTVLSLASEQPQHSWWVSAQIVCPKAPLQLAGSASMNCTNITPCSLTKQAEKCHTNASTTEVDAITKTKKTDRRETKRPKTSIRDMQQGISPRWRSQTSSPPRSDCEYAEKFERMKFYSLPSMQLGIRWYSRPLCPVFRDIGRSTWHSLKDMPDFI